MRSHAIPCRGASLQESIAGRHLTWADDAYCDRCRALNARSVAEVRKSATGFLSVDGGTGGHGPPAVTSHSSLVPLLEAGERGPAPGLVSVPAGSLPDSYVTDRCAPASQANTSRRSLLALRRVTQSVAQESEHLPAMRRPSSAC